MSVHETHNKKNELDLNLNDSSNSNAHRSQSKNLNPNVNPGLGKQSHFSDNISQGQSKSQGQGSGQEQNFGQPQGNEGLHEALGGYYNPYQSTGLADIQSTSQARASNLKITGNLNPVEKDMPSVNPHLTESSLQSEYKYPDQGHYYSAGQKVCLGNQMGTILERVTEKKHVGNLLVHGSESDPQLVIKLHDSHQMISRSEKQVFSENYGKGLKHDTSNISESTNVSGGTTTENRNQGVSQVQQDNSNSGYVEMQSNA